MQSSYEEIKEALGGKDPEQVLYQLLHYVKQIKPKKILATTVEEENTNWDRLEAGADHKLDFGLSLLNAEKEKTKNQILLLQDNWDDEGSKGYRAETYSKATEIVKALVVNGASRLKKTIPIPKILPGPNGSIDLHWQTTEYDLLINVPENLEGPVSFAGEDSGKNCINGTFVNNQIDPVLLAWLK